MLHQLKRAGIIAAVNIVFLNFYLIYYGYGSLINWFNGFQILGLVQMFFGLLVLIADNGAFDMLGYSFYYLGGSRHKTEERKYTDYKDYIDKKTITRKAHMLNFLSYEMSGALFVIISLIMQLFL